MVRTDAYRQPAAAWCRCGVAIMVMALTMAAARNSAAGPVPASCADQYDGAPCDDQDPCTVDDYCDAGDCIGGRTVDADWDGFPDGNCAGGTDCDDQDSTAYPGAYELCDAVDNDCDGTIDNDAYCTDYDGCTEPDTCVVGSCVPGPLRDADGDGFADVWCGGTDCHDGDSTIFPGAVEVCDGVDNDCDGNVDNGCVTPTPTPTPTGTPTPTVGSCPMCGDVSGDRAVTIVDALFISQHTVGLRPTLPCPTPPPGGGCGGPKCGDVSGDDSVTIVDALFISQQTVGLRPTLPCTVPTPTPGS
jgi:hypothetical protein